MVRDGYPRLFAGRPEEAAAADLAARTFEFSEFLVDVLGVEELPARSRRRARRRTFHHSCHTRRLLGVAEQPERLLGMVEGLEYVPLGHPELCCGFGGTFAVKMPRISTAMVDEKVDARPGDRRRPARRSRHELPDEHRGPAAPPREPGRGASPGRGTGRGVAGVSEMVARSLRLAGRARPRRRWDCRR